MKTIAVLDFGGQYAHLIATRIRALGLKAVMAAPEEFRYDSVPDLAGIVFSGSPHSVSDAGSPTATIRPEDSPVPILGLCYGHQLLARLLGGEVCRGRRREYGAVEIRVGGDSPLFRGLPETQTVWM